MSTLPPSVACPWKATSARSSLSGPGTGSEHRRPRHKQLRSGIHRRRLTGLITKQFVRGQGLRFAVPELLHQLNATATFVQRQVFGIGHPHLQGYRFDRSLAIRDTSGIEQPPLSDGPQVNGVLAHAIPARVAIRVFCHGIDEGWPHDRISRRIQTQLLEYCFARRGSQCVVALAGIGLE